MFTVFNKFLNNNQDNVNNQIYIAAEGNFDQELLQNMLKYANSKKKYGNHTLVIDKNNVKLSKTQ